MKNIILPIVLVLVLEFGQWRCHATDILPNPSAPGNVGSAAAPFPNVYTAAVQFSDGTSQKTAGSQITNAFNVIIVAANHAISLAETNLMTTNAVLFAVNTQPGAVLLTLPVTFPNSFLVMNLSTNQIIHTNLPGITFLVPSGTNAPVYQNSYTNSFPMKVVQFAMLNSSNVIIVSERVTTAEITKNFAGASRFWSVATNGAGTFTGATGNFLGYSGTNGPEGSPTELPISPTFNFATGLSTLPGGASITGGNNSTALTVAPQDASVSFQLLAAATGSGAILTVKSSSGTVFGTINHAGVGTGIFENNPWGTNKNLVVPDFTQKFSLLGTNAAFTFLPPVGVDPTATSVQSIAIYVTNSTTVAIAITPPAMCHTSGTMNVTNLSRLTVETYGGVITNMFCDPIF